MKDLIYLITQGEFFAYVIDVLEGLSIPYMVTGSIASMAYGEPRLTIDMDIVIDLSTEMAERFCAKFETGKDFYVHLDSVLEAIRQRGHFNIIHVPSGSKVDFYQLKKDPLSQEMFKRRNEESFDEKRMASFSSPEDVIINKLIFYNEGKSEKHLRDIRGMLQVSGDKLDISYLEKRLEDLGLYQYWGELKKWKRYGY